MATKKAAARRSPAKKGVAKKAAAKVAEEGGVPAKKVGAKKVVAKKAAGRKYSPSVSAQVGRELHEMHRGQLHIGKSDKKVTNPKQAIAIALSEARRAGKKVPPNPNDPDDPKK